MQILQIFWKEDKKSHFIFFLVLLGRRVILNTRKKFWLHKLSPMDTVGVQESGKF